MWALWADRWEHALTLRRCLQRMTERLEGIGLTPEAVRRYREGAERVMADESALERMGN